MNNKTIELTDELQDALYEVFEDIANLTNEELYNKIKTARIIAKAIGIDPADFYLETGGFLLDSDSKHPCMLENYI
jgi:hypothetical protein